MPAKSLITAENFPPDSFWGKPVSALTEKFPLLTPDVVTQWQLAAKEIGMAFSGHPGRTRLSALLVSPENELVAVGVNNLVGGITWTQEYEDKGLYYAHCLCAEQGAITACACSSSASSAGNIMITPLVPCENCAKVSIGGQISAMVTNPQELESRKHLLDTWADKLEWAKTALDRACDPAVLTVSTRIPAGAELRLDLNRLELRSKFNGHVFAQPIPYESLRTDNPALLIRPAAVI